jgi:hypothetical protein
MTGYEGYTSFGDHSIRSLIKKKHAMRYNKHSIFDKIYFGFQSLLHLTFSPKTYFLMAGLKDHQIGELFVKCVRVFKI